MGRPQIRETSKTPETINRQAFAGFKLPKINKTKNSPTNIIEDSESQPFENNEPEYRAIGIIMASQNNSPSLIGQHTVFLERKFSKNYVAKKMVNPTQMNPTVKQTKKYGPTLDKTTRESVSNFADKVLTINRFNNKKLGVNNLMQSLLLKSDQIIETVREGSSNKSLQSLKWSKNRKKLSQEIHLGED